MNKAVFLDFLIAFKKCCLEDGRSLTVKSILMTILIGIFISGAMYFITGCILAIFNKTIALIEDIKDNQISTKMLVSFLLLILYIFFSMASENELKENLEIMLLVLGICYVLNIQILAKIVRNPFCLFGGKQNKSEDKAVVVFTVILILLMFVVNLYLLVLWVFYSYEGAYFCSIEDGVVTKWKLFYYTIISFTTIGYGDISPAIFESQAAAIVISITSVLCLIIFICMVSSSCGMVVISFDFSSTSF